MFISPALRPSPASPEHVTEDVDSSKRADAGYDVGIFSRQPILSSTAIKTDETASCETAMERPASAGDWILDLRRTSQIDCQDDGADRDNV
jgi:hypothetical protein